MLNLDTHVLLHALSGELTPRERHLLERDTWSISAIVLWEIAKLAELKRIAVDLDDKALSRALSSTLSRVSRLPMRPLLFRTRQARWSRGRRPMWRASTP